MRFSIFILKPNAFLLDPPYGKEIRQTKINLFLQFFLPFCPMKFEFMIKNQRKKRIEFIDKNAKTHCIYRYIHFIAKSIHFAIFIIKLNAFFLV